MTDQAAAKLEAVLDVLVQLAAGQLDARVSTTGGHAPIDLVATAVNMLGEELAVARAAEAELRERLEREIAERVVQLEALTRAQETVARQTEALLELSTPVIEVWPGVLILPLIGLVDEARAQQIMDQLLSAIERSGARVAILDITGVAAIDTSVANHLLAVIAASRLLGARTIMTGVSPDNAHTLVRLGVDFERVHTESSLHAALRHALTQR